MSSIQFGKAVLAGISGTLVMTVMTMVAPMMGLPEMHIPAMLAGFMGVPVLVGWMAHFMIGTVLAINFAAVSTKLPGSSVARGMLFGLAPWFLAQIMVNPVMGAGVFAVNTPAPFLMVLGSLMGHLVFGAVVGWVYAVRRLPEAVQTTH